MSTSRRAATAMICAVAMAACQRTQPGASSTAVAAAPATSPAPAMTPVQTPRPPMPTGLPDMSVYLNKMPTTSGLLKDPVLAARLKAMMGEAKYQSLLQDWQVESPLSVEDGVYHTNGCQTHNCFDVDYHLFLDPATDDVNLYAFRGGKMEAFEDKRAIPLPEDLAADLAAVKTNHGVK